MSDSNVPQQVKELLVCSVDEAFADAEISQKRWEQWEIKNRLTPVAIQLPEAEYKILEDLAIQQQTTAPELIQSLVHSVLSTLIRSAK